MKVCIYGAGAIGGFVASRLANSVELSLVARGPHLRAMQEQGLTLVEADGETKTNRVTATDKAASLGVQDYVIVTLKAHSLPTIVDDLLPLIGPMTTVISAVNGIPWWYTHGLDSKYAERCMESVDPGGKIWNAIGPDKAVGCVVYPSAEIVQPGVIRHLSDNKFSLGEPNGTKTDRVKMFADLMIDNGLKAPVRPRLRDEIWIKLWGNLAFNPLSVLTGADLYTLATEPGTRTIARNMMLEAQNIGEELGIRFSVDVDRRIAGAAAVGAHRTSMLQDFDSGRPLEIGALVGAVQELGSMLSFPTPTIDMVHDLLAQRISVRDTRGA